MIQAISRVTLTQSISDQMLKLIKDGTWKPGDKIPSENELASSFSVSRNSIREAVKILNKMNVLTSCPGQGTFLAQDAVSRILSLEVIDIGYKNASVEEIYEIRTLLESQSAYWAALRVTDDDIDELNDLLRLSRDNENRDIAEQNRIHYAFHDAIIRMSKNTLLIHMLSSIKAEIDAHHASFDNLPAADITNLINDQEKVIAAILNKKPEEARLAMISHLERAMRLIK
ncbi:FadR/GntR family transcriptional regulator [Cloacibacillus evryensis]|uniref:FadR/GntR family transcriptional regulator n=1 Tax=Cloacibacillus evryensis TaxID=508460 RepID=UPI000447FCA6|nr:FadR/GntR family transcriptional regulator [Cloacibacillus evryensis]EXG78427.1 transcriptional regulator [Cloacibacillus evryensis DSM 19522]MCQ4764821.1 FadR family transcriptional regulator [Cloacibacillus evryensis]MEA5036503.1 FadR/GntR family transcriptional regulator [Cloacibacillus evryensis]